MPTSEQPAERPSSHGAQCREAPRQNAAARDAIFETRFLLSVFAELTGRDRPQDLLTKEEIE
ncbi:hypothetical protein [Pelagibius marinus]|uniref:hypothetical protein n=1 Tax=Pelagibius marinus TaxID=2762760 RepID=UPI00187300F1|nr:hypothetical protein [Pelagibius marinus]